MFRARDLHHSLNRLYPCTYIGAEAHFMSTSIMWRIVERNLYCWRVDFIMHVTWLEDVFIRNSLAPVDLHKRFGGTLRIYFFIISSFPSVLFSKLIGLVFAWIIKPRRYAIFCTRTVAISCTVKAIKNAQFITITEVERLLRSIKSCQNQCCRSPRVSAKRAI